MTLALKDNLQIVVPPSMQRRAGFKLGDQLEFKATRGVITIVPKSSPPSLSAALSRTRDAAQRKGSAELTMKDINGEITATRKAKRATKARLPGK